MKYLTLSLLLFLFSLSQIQCTQIESKPLDTDPIEPLISDTLNSFLLDFERDFANGMQELRIPGGAVVLMKDGNIIYEKGFGVLESGVTGEVNEHTVFRLGSVSKGFASVLAGTLVEDSLIAWEDPVVEHFETFELHDAEQTKRVEIQHILSHTSGLPRHAYTNLVEDGLSLSRIISRLDQVPLISQEGEQIAYQNAGYAVIEKVLEEKTNTDFNTLLQERLFEPLGMEHTSSTHDVLRITENKAEPHLYNSRMGKRVSVPITKKYYNAVSAGGINASISDMGKWLQLLVGKHPNIIHPNVLDEIYTPIATINNKRFSRYWDGVNESHYGMGWRVLYNGSQKIVYHGGYVNGYRSEIAFDKETQTGICILINAPSRFPLEIIPAYFEEIALIN